MNVLPKIFPGGGRSLVAASLALAVVLGVANYFLWQQRLAVTQRHDEVRRKGEAILAALINHEHINSDLAKLQAALEVIDRNLVVETDMEVNLGYFYKLEKLCHIRLTQLNQLSSPLPPEGNPFKAIPISLRATGSYAQLMDFLHQLETGPRILAVSSFSFTRGDPKANALSFDLTINMLGRQ